MMNRSLFADRIQRRDRLQIYADIVKVSNQESKITKILRLANVQYNTFHECIEKLIKAGLLKKVDHLNKPHPSQDMRTSYAFEATEMGVEWCKMVDRLYETLREL